MAIPPPGLILPIGHITTAGITGTGIPGTTEAGTVILGTTQPGIWLGTLSGTILTATTIGTDGPIGTTPGVTATWTATYGDIATGTVPGTIITTAIGATTEATGAVIITMAAAGADPGKDCMATITGVTGTPRNMAEWVLAQ